MNGFENQSNYDILNTIVNDLKNTKIINCFNHLPETRILLIFLFDLYHLYICQTIAISVNFSIIYHF